MSYVNSILAEDEHILAKAKLTFWIYFNPLNLIFFAFLKRWSTEMALTNRRIIYKRGIIARNTMEISLHKIESVGVSQSIVGRILDYGQVYVQGTGGHKEKFDGIGSPLIFKKAIDAALVEDAKQ